MANTSLRSRVNRFFHRNRGVGIPNLLFLILIGNGLVFLLTMMNRENPLFYRILCFDRDRILHGEVWRLLTYVLTDLTEHSGRWILELIVLWFTAWTERILGQYWGVLKTNCYYLLGILLTDAAALLLGFNANCYYLNISMFLAIATLMPEEQIRFWFVLPLKMKWLAWLYLGLAAWEIIKQVQSMVAYGWFSFFWTMPLISLLNYALFFGKDILNIMPDFIKYHPSRKSWNRKVKQASVYDAPRRQGQARFQCTVCGRTELSNPGLEFRYCSRCAGYRCYCADHINNHTHITE